MGSQTNKQDSPRLIPSKSALKPRLRNDPALCEAVSFRTPTGAPSPIAICGAVSFRTTEGTSATLWLTRESVPTAKIRSWQITAEAIAKSNWWQMFLIAVGIATSVIYPHVPLISFAAVAGNTLTRNKALITVTSIWFANQLYGFIIRQYPKTLESLTWGLIMGLGMLAVTWLVTLQPKFSRRSFRGYLIWLVISLVGGYTIYQGGIVLIAQLAGGHGFSSAILWKIFVKDVIWAIAS